VIAPLTHGEKSSCFSEFDGGFLKECFTFRPDRRFALAFLRKRPAVVVLRAPPPHFHNSPGSARKVLYCLGVQLYSLRTRLLLPSLCLVSGDGAPHLTCSSIRGTRHKEISRLSSKYYVETDVFEKRCLFLFFLGPSRSPPRLGNTWMTFSPVPLLFFSVNLEMRLFQEILLPVKVIFFFLFFFWFFCYFFLLFFCFSWVWVFGTLLAYRLSVHGLPLLSVDLPFPVF